MYERDDSLLTKILIGEAYYGKTKIVFKKSYEYYVNKYKSSANPIKRVHIKDYAKKVWPSIFNNSDFGDRLTFSINTEGIVVSDYQSYIDAFFLTNRRGNKYHYKKAAEKKFPLEFNKDDFPRKERFPSYEDAIKEHDNSKDKVERSNIKHIAKTKFPEFNKDDFENLVYTYEYYVKNFMKLFADDSHLFASQKRRNIKTAAKNRYPRKFNEDDFPKKQQGRPSHKKDLLLNK